MESNFIRILLNQKS